jgi:glycogen synthase
MDHNKPPDQLDLVIAFFCEQYPPVVWDGAGTYTAVLAQALAALGHEVHVICAQGHRISDEVVDGVRVHRRPLLRLPVSRAFGRFGRLVAGRNYPRDSLTLRASLALSYSLWLRHLGLRPDVIETQDGETRALTQALLHSYPLVVHMHAPTMLTLRLAGADLTWKGRLADRLDRATSDRATVVTSPSPLLVDTVRPYGWLRGRDVRIVPNPFDPGPWHQVPSPGHSGQVVAAVGRLEPNKGLDILIDAAALLARRGVDTKLILAGRSSGHVDGTPTGQWLERRAHDMDVPCVFAGHLTRAELAGVYAQSRVVAVPSRFESFSIAAVEGMAAGRPVVTTDRTGIAPFVTEWKAGRVVPAEDPEALADALTPYLLDPKLAATVGANGRAGAAKLNPTTIAREREQVYRAAIEQFRARG